MPDENDAEKRAPARAANAFYASPRYFTEEQVRRRTVLAALIGVAVGAAGASGLSNIGN